MDELIDFKSEPGTPATVRDQRRPGRPEHVDPNLIPLLRGETAPIAQEVPETAGLSELLVEPDRRTTLSAARGICLGVALGTVTWAGIGVSLWLWFKG